MLIPVFQHRIINMESSSTHTVRHVKAFRLKPFGGKKQQNGLCGDKGQPYADRRSNPSVSAPPSRQPLRRSDLSLIPGICHLGLERSREHAQSGPVEIRLVSHGR